MNSTVPHLQTFAYVVNDATQQPTAVFTSNSIIPPKTEMHDPDPDIGQLEPWLSIT